MDFYVLNMSFYVNLCNQKSINFDFIYKKNIFVTFRANYEKKKSLLRHLVHSLSHLIWIHQMKNTTAQCLRYLTNNSDLCELNYVKVFYSKQNSYQLLFSHFYCCPEMIIKLKCNNKWKINWENWIFGVVLSLLFLCYLSINRILGVCAVAY